MGKLKIITIDEYCGQPPGSFSKFIKNQEIELKKIEKARKARIGEFRNLKY
jgi:hypothetical protein